MIDGNEGLSGAQCQSLGRHQGRHHATYQPRPGRCGDPVELADIQPGRLKRLRGQPVHRLGMRARGNLGHNASKGRVGLGLAQHQISQNFDTAGFITTQDRSRALVTAGLQSQHDQRAWLRGGGWGG